MTIFYALGGVVSAGTWSIHVGMAPWLYATLNIAIEYPYTILVVAFVYPFLARWMVECETLKGASLIVPPYGN